VFLLLHVWQFCAFRVVALLSIGDIYVEDDYRSVFMLYRNQHGNKSTAAESQ